MCSLCEQAICVELAQSSPKPQQVYSTPHCFVYIVVPGTYDCPIKTINSCDVRGATSYTPQFTRTCGPKGGRAQAELSATIHQYVFLATTHVTICKFHHWCETHTDMHGLDRSGPGRQQRKLFFFRNLNSSLSYSTCCEWLGSFVFCTCWRSFVAPGPARISTQSLNHRSRLVSILGCPNTGLPQNWCFSYSSPLVVGSDGWYMLVYQTLTEDFP